jgi:hypothetical protein
MLAGLLLWAGGCQSTVPEDDQPAVPTVQGPALIAYFSDN